MILVGVVWAFGLAGYLGIPLTIVTIAGLPGDARRRHRLRDPDARARRGGGGHRPRRPPDPGDGAQPRPGAARRHVRRRVRLRRPALRQGADDPRVRPAARRRHRRDLPQLASSSPLAVLGIREYKSPTKGRDFREGPLGRLVVVARQPAGVGRGPARRGERRRSSSAASPSRTSSTCRPTRSSGSTRSRRSSRTSTRSTTRSGSSSELGVFVQSDDVFTRRDRRASSHDFAASSSPRTGTADGSCSPPSSIVTIVSDLIDVPGAADVAPTGEDVRAAYDVAPRGHPAVDGRPTTTAALNIMLPHRRRLARGRGPKVVDEIRDARRTRPEGITRDAVGAGRRRRRPAREPRGQPHPADLPGDRCSCSSSSPCGCGVVRSLLSLVPVLIAVGAASLVAWTRSSLKLSPMTAVGGPLVVAACTEFTSLILLRFVEERRRGLDPQEAVDVAAVAHRAGVHRVRPDRDRRRRRAVVLVAAAAARLRPHRRHERRRRAAQRPRRAAAAAGVGRPARLGVARLDPARRSRSSRRRTSTPATAPKPPPRRGADRDW